MVRQQGHARAATNGIVICKRIKYNIEPDTHLVEILHGLCNHARNPLLRERLQLIIGNMNLLVPRIIRGPLIHIADKSIYLRDE